MRVLVACLAVVGVIMLGLLALGLLQWIIGIAVVLGLIYGAFKIGTLGRSTVAIGDRSLNRKLKRLERSASRSKERH